MPLERKIIEGREYTCWVDEKGEIISIMGDPMKDKAEAEAKAMEEMLERQRQTNKSYYDEDESFYANVDNDVPESWWKPVYDHEGNQMYILGTREFTPEYWAKILKEAAVHAEFESKHVKKIWHREKISIALSIIGTIVVIVGLLVLGNILYKG